MLLENIKIVRVSNAAAAGQTEVVSTAVDTQGYDGVLFLIAIGAIVTGAVVDAFVQAGELSNGTDHVTLEGTYTPIADDQDNKVLALEVYRPQSRYVRVSVGRETQNATVDGIVAVLYNGRKAPTVADATLMALSKVVASPAFQAAE